MSSESYHEPVELLSEDTKNMHRALVSLREELEAVDWYQQRAEACTDTDLAAVLTHNKNEEIEHAIMTLEWIRRQSSEFDENLATYLRADGPITQIEAAAEGKATAANGATAAPSSEATSLGIGGLRPARANGE